MLRHGCGLHLLQGGHSDTKQHSIVIACMQCLVSKVVHRHTAVFGSSWRYLSFDCAGRCGIVKAAIKQMLQVALTLPPDSCCDAIVSVRVVLC
eukprot:4561634-Amphidinium_carterae.1